MTQIRSWLLMATTLFLTATLVSATQAQDRGSGRRGSGMMRGSFLGLLSMEEVQKELKLNQDQIGKIKEMDEKQRAERREQYAGLREIEDRQERRTKMTELRERFDEKARGEVRELLAREQMMRLYQIRLQVRRAVYGLNNEWIANRLKLTDEQKQKAANLEKATQDKIFEVYSGLRDLSQEERRKKYAELPEKTGKIRGEADEQALGLLNPEQKEALEELKGEPFEP